MLDHKLIADRFGVLLEAAPDATLVTDDRGGIVFVNARAVELFGFAIAELLGQRVEILVPERMRAQHAQHHRAGTSTSRTMGLGPPLLALRKDGREFPAEISLSPIEVDGVRLTIAAIRDVSERVALMERLERSSAASEERLRHVISSSPAVLYTLRVEDGERLVPMWTSDNIEDAIGYTPADVADEAWWLDHVHPDDREHVLAQAEGLFASGRTEREYRFRRAGGSYIWIRDEQRLLRDAAGKPLEVIGSWWDVTDRKRAELRLKQSEEEYHLLFARHPQPLWVFDSETLAFLDVNDAAIRHYGYSRDEFLAMTIKDIRPPEEVPQLMDTLGKGDSRAGPYGIWKHRRKNGETMLVEIVSSPIVFRGRSAEVVLANDVTEKATLQSQLLQAQKMEAIGQLAGGVAHDFNNLLGVISGYATLLLKDLGTDHAGVKRVEQIRKAADRAANLTRQLLAFSRKQVLEPKLLDLNAVLTDVEPMLRRLLGEDIELVVMPARDLPPVKADPGQIEQVIVNLCVNARDAMPSGGTLMLETGNFALSAAYAGSNPEVEPGRYVMLAISDTGHGMDAATQARIFEPFFTTKSEGKGTGLGLAMVFGIVKQSGGHIAVESEVGRGTTFRVYLPRVTDQAASKEVPAAAPAATRGASETLLVVEDAEALRTMIVEILEQAGYRVLAAANAEDALNRAARYDGPIHLLLTDVVMPGMGGRQLGERLARFRPRTRVLYMSGYTDEAIGHHGALDPGTHFIQKPFNGDVLLQKLRAVLDQR